MVDFGFFIQFAKQFGYWKRAIRQTKDIYLAGIGRDQSLQCGQLGIEIEQVDSKYIKCIRKPFYLYLFHLVLNITLSKYLIEEIVSYLFGI